MLKKIPIHDLFALERKLQHQLRQVQMLISVQMTDLTYGPEAARDEVAPSGRSPQRDCMAARVAPAVSFQPSI